MWEHCKKIHLQPGCCCTCTLATLTPTPKKTRRICVNLRNGLWQKWGGHVHPVAMPLILTSILSCLELECLEYFTLLAEKVISLVLPLSIHTDASARIARASTRGHSR